MDGRQWDSNPQEEKYVLLEMQPCCSLGHVSDISMVSKICLYGFMRLYIDQITVYQSLFINKANVNRGSRNGMTCSNVDDMFNMDGALTFNLPLQTILVRNIDCMIFRLQRGLIHKT